MNKKLLLISIIVSLFALLAAFNAIKGRGYVKIDSPDVELTLKGGLFKGFNFDIKSGTLMKLKEGSYKTSQIHLVKKSEQGIWRICCHNYFGELAKIEVKKNETRVLKIGELLTAKANITRRLPSSLDIGLDLVGSAGEKYNPVISNSKRSVSPMIIIKDQKNNILVNAKMAYG